MSVNKKQLKYMFCLFCAIFTLFLPDENNEEVAKGSDALSILENTETRNLFIDELLEVNIFSFFSTFPCCVFV